MKLTDAKKSGRFTPVLLLVLLISPAMLTAASVPIIPLPAKVESREGMFQLTAASRIVVPPKDGAAAQAASELATLLRRTRGVKLPVIAADAHALRAGDIALLRDGSINAAEAYRLDVGRDGLRVRAATSAGLLYGAITAWQLLTADGSVSLTARVEGVTIEDQPRFAWRGLMLDSVRHFRSVAEVKQVIDWMVQHKLNTLHWHLTDDQGWRLQIRRYPLLTQHSGWRTPLGAQAKDANGKPVRYGGFYTQAQAREIVAYAKARNVTVVPEIEMPGHSQAAIAAYPWLGVTGRRPQVANSWGVSSYIFNTDEATFTFLQNVLDEVMEIFPSTFIHVGGDEADKGQWKASAEVQARMKAAGIADEQALQSWFIKRIEDYLGRHGRRLIGWDEILEGGLPPRATVMSWRGTKGAITAAQDGHDVVLTPGVPLYFDQKQSASADEPPGQPTINTLRKVYEFDPLPPELASDRHQHVLGAQANLWAEYLRTFDQLQLKLFPRIAALAEITWSTQSTRDWNGFVERLQPQLRRYRSQGIKVADNAFAPQFSLAAGPEPRSLQVGISRQEDVGRVHYTLDGREPTAASPVYSQPLAVKLPGVLKAATFAISGQRLSATRTAALDALVLRTRLSEELVFCDGQTGIRLEDDWPLQGPRPVLHTQLRGVCLQWKDAPLRDARRIEVEMGQVVNAFMYGRPGDGDPVPEASTDSGALRVWRGACDSGEMIAEMPIMPARRSPGLHLLNADLPAELTDGDVCMRLDNAAKDLTWAVRRVRFLP